VTALQPRVSVAALEALDAYVLPMTHTLCRPGVVFTDATKPCRPTTCIVRFTSPRTLLARTWLTV